MGNVFAWYLLIVNILSFLVSFLCFRRSWLVCLLSVLGGSAGILLGFMRKADKEHMLGLVFAACLLVIQASLFYLWKAGSWPLNLDFVSFFSSSRYLVFYLALLNVLAFLLYGWDKLAAKRSWRRLPIVFLLGLAFFGGSLGALLGMAVFHHKTRKPYFYIGVPLMLVMQVVLLVVFMNVR